MATNRRRWLQAVAAASGFGAAAEGQGSEIPLEVLRDVSKLHGSNLSDARLRIVRPALERRLEELRAMRAFEPGDAVGPTEGILPKNPSVLR